MTVNVTPNSPVRHKGMQGNMEGESSFLSEVTWAFFQAPLQMALLEIRKHFKKCLK